MELSYKQLEATLFAHFRIHPNKQDTFRSRIKQLQRMKPAGFPEGVNVGRGVKMEYSAAHLFQMVTAFELIGAGLPAERATRLVSANWPTLAVGYALAVQGINLWRFNTPIFAWVLSRSFGELQTEPYAVPRHPLSNYPDSSRVVIADSEGLSVQLLSQINRRRAHAYTLLPLSDLSTHVLKAAEDFGGCTTLRRDQEFIDWLPPQDIERDGWLFISFDPWAEGPRAYDAAGSLSTEEVIHAHNIQEHMRMAIAHRRIETAEQAKPNPALRKAAEALVPDLSLAAARVLTRGLGDDDDEENLAAMDELYALSLLEPYDDDIRITPLGVAVAAVVEPGVAAAEAQAELQLPDEPKPQSKRKRSK